MATPKANYRKIQGDLESRRRSDSTKREGKRLRNYEAQNWG
jgi:hypothetical protein